MAFMHKPILFLSLLLLLSACKTAYRLDYQQTAEIKKYGLLFRLSDFKQRIDYFETNGMADRAQAEKLKIKQDNQELVDLFKKGFDFCPVRFFYASQQEALLAGQPVLLNDQLEPDAAIPLPEKRLVAYYAPGKLEDNQFKGQAFRILGTTALIRPRYTTWLTGQGMKASDVRKINKVLYKRAKLEKPGPK